MSERTLASAQSSSLRPNNPIRQTTHADHEPGAGRLPPVIRSKMNINRKTDTKKSRRSLPLFLTRTTSPTLSAAWSRSPHVPAGPALCTAPRVAKVAPATMLAARVRMRSPAPAKVNSPSRAASLVPTRLSSGASPTGDFGAARPRPPALSVPFAPATPISSSPLAPMASTGTPTTSRSTGGLRQHGIHWRVRGRRSFLRPFRVVSSSPNGSDALA